MRQQEIPVVTLVGLVTERVDDQGQPLDAVLITKHLSYSVPLRSLFSSPSSVGLRSAVIDALALLLVRIHLAGFFWGDASLNNGLYRRDAGAVRAYLVDTETGEWHPSLSEGQREFDVSIAVENVAGGLFDLQAAGVLPNECDPVELASRVDERYHALWNELTETEVAGTDELWRIQERMRRLNALGFDTDEFEITAADGQVSFRPSAVHEGHHKRRLARSHRHRCAREPGSTCARLRSSLRGVAEWQGRQRAARGRVYLSLADRTMGANDGCPTARVAGSARRRRAVSPDTGARLVPRRTTTCRSAAT